MVLWSNLLYKIYIWLIRYVDYKMYKFIFYVVSQSGFGNKYNLSNTNINTLII